MQAYSTDEVLAHARTLDPGGGSIHHNEHEAITESAPETEPASRSANQEDATEAEEPFSWQGWAELENDPVSSQSSKTAFAE